MADGPKVTPEQLAMMDQLNQKLATGEVTAKAYAEAIKSGGLEMAHQVRLLEQQVAKMDELLSKAQQANLDATSYNTLVQQRVSTQQNLNNLMSTGVQHQKDGLAARREANKEATKLTAEAKKLSQEMEAANVWGQGFIMEIAKGESTVDSLAQKIASIPGAIGQGAIDAITDSMILNFTAADNMQANFNKITGQGGAMNATIMNAHRGVGSLGVSMESAGAAAGALYQDFNQFSSMNAQMQTEMIQTTASLENLGISASDTAQNIALASNGFGMTAKESVNLQNDLAKTAMAIGMPPAKLASEFKKAAPQLAVYGKKGIEVFKSMAAASKGLGVEMGTLLGITEQFDTFEGAAQAAGNLNAMLGGDLLNSMDLMNATQDEQVRMLLGAVDASGKSWNSMNKFEKKAIASAAGITDMAEANALFAGGLKGYDEAQKKAAENAKSDAELAEAKAAAVSIMDKMKLITQQLAVALGPLITGMHFLMDGILGVNDMFGGYLLPVLVGGVAAFYALYKAAQFVVFVKKAMAVASAIAAAGSVKEAIAAGQNAAAKGTSAAMCGQLQMCLASETAAKITSSSATAANSTASQLNASAKVGEASAQTSATAATTGGMLATIRQTAAKIANRIATMAGIAASYAAAAASTLLTGATTALTAATNLGIVATIREGAVKAASATKTYALLAAEKAAALGKFLLAKASALLAFVFGGQSTAQTAVAATSVPAAAGTGAMGAASAAAAGPVLVLGIGVGLLAIGIGLLAIAIAAIVWAFVYLIQLFMDAPGKAIMAAGALLVLGVAVALLTVIFAALAPIAPIAAAAMVTLGTGMMFLVPPALLLSVALMMFAFAISLLNVGNMVAFAAAIIPFAIAMAFAAPFIAFAGALLGPAALPFAYGAVLVAAGIFALGLASPYLVPLMAILPAAIALALAAPLLLFAGVMMSIAGIPFIIGSVLVAIGMAILAGPLMQFAQAIAVLGPFIPALPMLAIALLMLGFALPIFGFGLFMLGLFASMPFFDTGLEVLVGALYSFADAMSGIPTEKAVALGQIFQGLAGLTDMDGVGSALYDFSFGVMFLGYALTFMPDGATLMMMAEGLKMFAETGAKHVLPVSIALYAAAPYLLGAALLLAPAAFMLLLAGPPLAAAMFWIGMAFGFMGAAPAKAGLQAVKSHFFGAAVALFFGAPLLFIASIYLFFAGPLFFTGALFISMGLRLLNEPLLFFAGVLAVLGPFIPLLVPLAYGLFTLGLALPVLGFGLFMLGLYASLPFFRTGLNTLAEALYIFADAMSAIPTEKAVALGQIFTGLAAMTDMDNMADAIYETADAIWYLAWTMMQVPEESIFKMQGIVEAGLEPMNELAKNMTPEVAVSAGQLVNEAERYMQVQAEMKAPADDAFAQAVIESSKAQAARANADKAAAESGGGGGQDVVLVLNERELGRAVEVILNKRINLGVS